MAYILHTLTCVSFMNVWIMFTCFCTIFCPLYHYICLSSVPSFVFPLPICFSSFHCFLWNPHCTLSYPSQKEDNLCYCCKDRWMLQKLYSMKNVWYLYSKLNRGILDVILKYPHVSSPLVLRNHISQLSLLLNTGQEAQCILLLCFHCLPSCANTLGLALRKEIWVLSNVLL